MKSTQTLRDLLDLEREISRLRPMGWLGDSLKSVSERLAARPPNARESEAIVRLAGSKFWRSGSKFWQGQGGPGFWTPEACRQKIVPLLEKADLAADEAAIAASPGWGRFEVNPSAGPGHRASSVKRHSSNGLDIVQRVSRDLCHDYLEELASDEPDFSIDKVHMYFGECRVSDRDGHYIEMGGICGMEILKVAERLDRCAEAMVADWRQTAPFKANSERKKA